MSDRRTLASGDVLDGRYELQDLVTERLGATTWRAHDRVLSRNVGIEMVPSTDPRAEAFLGAARRSTMVADPRFLRVLDIIETDHGHHLVIREWARAFPLDQLLAQSSLPNRRAATVVAEVAEAMAHAHEYGIHHRRLTPHQVLLKQSGAVRIVGLGVAAALASTGEEVPDPDQSEQADVEALGKLLYACLVSRWPGAHVDSLRAAPTEHGRLLRPRQVRAGVSRDVDTVCDRILGTPPRNHKTPLRTASDIARVLRLVGEDDDDPDDQPSLVQISSPDLLRLDPVIVPVGPPPGLEPPRRRPKAHQPAPPTTLERASARAAQATKGDRGLVLLGIVGTLLIATILAFLVGRTTGGGADPASPTASPRDTTVRTLPVREVADFDPQGEDGEENPDEVGLAVDGDPATGWRTAEYYGQATLGGLKDGVGLALDLGGPREVDSMRIRLGGPGTDLAVFASPPGADAPRSLRGLRRVAVLDDAGQDVTVSFPDGTLTRRVVVWLQRLPQVGDGEFRGEIREITVKGTS